MSSRNPISNRRVEEAIVAGQAALEDTRFEQAINYFKSALRMGPGSAEEEALIRCHLSEALEKKGLYREQFEAVSKYDNFSSFARLTESTQLSVLIRLGWAHSFNNNIPRAIALFNQAMQIARRMEDHAGIGACYFGMGRAYRFISEIRIARDHYLSALEHYRQIGNWRELAESYYNIGNIDAREGELRSAIQMINQALTIIGDRQDHELLGRAYSDLALIHDQLEVPTAKVLDYWEKSLKHMRQAGNDSTLAINYNNHAWKLIAIGDWKQAEELALRAISLLRQSMRFDNLAGSLDTLAQLYLLCGDLGEANLYLNESLQLFASLKSDKQPMHKEVPFEASTHITIARCHLVNDEPEEAIAHLERAVEIGTRLGDRQYFCESRLWLVEALFQIGQFERAEQIMGEVHVYLRENPNMPVWGHLQRMKAKLEAARGHFTLAHQSLSQSTSIYEIKGHAYDLAVNHIVLAQILEMQGAIAEAIREVECGLAVFRRLGAKIDAPKSEAYLASLRRKQLSANAAAQHAPPVEGVAAPHAASRAAMPAESVLHRSGISLVSLMDGFLTQRLIMASVSRELLLHELASVARTHAASRAAIVVECLQEEGEQNTRTNYSVAACSGLDAAEQDRAVEFLSALPADCYRSEFVFPFSDNQQGKFLLHIIEPKAERFINGSVTLEPLLLLVQQGLENFLLRSKNRKTKVFNPTRLLAQVELPGFICASRAMSRVIERINKIRSSDVTVLITGESGTGKELIARAVHGSGSRRFNTFLPFNCSAAPREMIESQLFGYRKGAFTGAVESNPGIVRAAEGGTLFLDEIGDLPLELQPKLLRFLQEGEVHPIGESKPVYVDVRVLAATNSDLERAVAEGKFREDLFHRLNVIRIQVPALRERREEIPALVNHYLKLYQQEAAKTEIQLSEEAVDLMVVYDWPGNVRQLCNEIRRIVAYSESGTVVTPETLSPEILRAKRDFTPDTAAAKRGAEITASLGGTLAEAIEEVERQMIQEALRKCAGNVARAAKELGLSRKGLYLKMDRLDFKA